MLGSQSVDTIFEIFQRHRPIPRIELNYTNHFTLLVAVILSAQSTDQMVNKVTKSLFLFADTSDKMISLGETELKKYIKNVGLYNNKAKYIIKSSNILSNKYGGIVPNTLQKLLQLPGVGRKSANVLLNSLFYQDTIGVDTHVFRVANRLALCNTKNPLETEKFLLKNVNQKWHRNLHNWIVMHGRYICKSRKPLCSICSVKNICQFPDKTNE